MKNRAPITQTRPAKWRCVHYCRSIIIIICVCRRRDDYFSHWCCRGSERKIAASRASFPRRPRSIGWNKLGECWKKSANKAAFWKSRAFRRQSRFNRLTHTKPADRSAGKAICFVFLARQTTRWKFRAKLISDRVSALMECWRNCFWCKFWRKNSSALMEFVLSVFVLREKV